MFPGLRGRHHNHLKPPLPFDSLNIAQKWQGTSGFESIIIECTGSGTLAMDKFSFNVTFADDMVSFGSKGWLQIT
jgi:hypothetical protein